MGSSHQFVINLIIDAVLNFVNENYGSVVPFFKQLYRKIVKIKYYLSEDEIILVLKSQ